MTHITQDSEVTSKVTQESGYNDVVERFSTLVHFLHKPTICCKGTLGVHDDSWSIDITLSSYVLQSDIDRLKEIGFVIVIIDPSLNGDAVRLAGYIDAKNLPVLDISPKQRYMNLYKKHTGRESELFVEFFAQRFGWNETESYFVEWIRRYEKGTHAFISYMDNQTKAIYEKVFCK